MKFDVVIIGGGLSGLSAGIMARRMGWTVALIEKKEYPFHKVCGEYISLESESILKWLGLPISDWNLPQIQNFTISSQSGKQFQSRLPLGGFGISRFELDQFLKNSFEKEGGILLCPEKATGILKAEDIFKVETTSQQYPVLQAKVVLGSFGRNKPQYLGDNNSSKNNKNYIGVKFHVQADITRDVIELHHFKGGYCGISAIENDKFCMCYLLKESLAKAFKGDFDAIESHILSQNPILKKYLKEFPKITARVSTGGVFFEKRPLTENGILFIGDSAGMIPPLAGNGMSMGLHSAVIAIDAIHNRISGIETIETAEQKYINGWNQAFSERLKTARYLQNAMEIELLTSATIRAFQIIPKLFLWTASKTHGQMVPFPKGF